MSILPVVLDDLTWTDLTESSRRRIPAASRGRWTLHAPVDPGVTLLELLGAPLFIYWQSRVAQALGTP